MSAEGEHEIPQMIGLGAVGDFERLKLAKENEEATEAPRRVIVGSKQQEKGSGDLPLVWSHSVSRLRGRTMDHGSSSDRFTTHPSSFPSLPLPPPPSLRSPPPPSLRSPPPPVSSSRPRIVHEVQPQELHRQDPRFNHRLALRALDH
eukprot:728369-Hanusia_phi.AAC.2